MSNAAKWYKKGLLITSILLLTACGEDQQGLGEPVVNVIIAEPTTVAVDTLLTGRLSAIREAEVRARAAGILEKRLFVEGGHVKANQPLFQIDNAPYVANLEIAKANFATAEANLVKSNLDLKRYQRLIGAKAVSKQEFDNVVAAQKQAAASVESAKASIKNAQINVNYALVTAPISGRIGRAFVTEGALVGQGEATQLAFIQQTDFLYVNLTQSADQAAKLRKSIAEGNIQRLNGVPQATIYTDEGEYPEKAELLFTDLTVDPDTGQVNLRAKVPNSKDVLYPGQFVRVALTEAQIDNAMLIPLQAVTRGKHNTVFVVNQDGSYQPKPVVISQQKGNYWVVTGGLEKGEQVVVEGMSAVFLTGAQSVKTQPWKSPEQREEEINTQSAQDQTDSDNKKE